MQSLLVGWIAEYFSIANCCGAPDLVVSGSKILQSSISFILNVALLMCCYFLAI